MSRKSFILIGLFWLVLIGGMVGFKEFTLRTGEEFLLRGGFIIAGAAKIASQFTVVELESRQRAGETFQ